MTRPRCPERIATSLRGGIYARCHRPPGHNGPCHGAGRTWHPYGEDGQRVRRAPSCFADCIPLPGPQPTRPERPKTTVRTRRTARRRR